MKRKKFKKLPLQANYYPIPTMVYIEDESIRLTITTGSPLGGSSLNPGQIEIMLDRRLNQDDNLGLGQGVMDNLPTKHIFRLILEKRKEDCQINERNNPAGYPTSAAYVASQSLLNPMIRLLRVEDEDEISGSVYTLTRDFGVDISMPVLKTNVRVKNNTYIGLIVHREFLNTCYDDKIFLEQFPLSDGSADLSTLLPISDERKLHRPSLSFLFVKNKENIQKKIKICLMETQAFIF